MEVHKHPHHVTHKKKWAEYLLEFFMLFLAVFLGFIAENIRENSVDTRKEKQYMQSMIEDLQKDTVTLNRIMKRTQYTTRLLDTTSHILLTGKMNDSLIKKLYALNLSVLSNTQTTLTDRTTSQLKNAGGLHLIQNAIVVESLFNYWEKAEEINKNSADYNELRLLAREKSYSIFNAVYYSSTPTGNRLNDSSTPRLMSTDSLILIEFANRLNHIKNSYQYVYTPHLKNEFEAAVKLIDLIRKEYHLKK